MSKNNVVKLAGRDTIADQLTELLGTGAEKLVYRAVEAELLELVDRSWVYLLCSDYTLEVSTRPWEVH